MLGLTVALLIAPLAAQSQSTQSTFHTEARLVVLHATVKNGRGELVTDLDRKAFSVYENGKRQPISIFRRDDIPVSLGLLVDNSGSMRRKRARVEAAALALVKASNPLDEVFVLNFADKPRLDVPFTSEVKVLEAGIARVDSIGGTAMRDAIDMAEGYLHDRGTRDRKALLVVSDGEDNSSVISLEQIQAKAEQDGVVVYAVGLLSEGDAGQARRARRDLDRLAEATGGVAYYPESLEMIDGVALDLARQIRNQYTIGYTPLNQALDGTFRKLRVVVTGRDRLTVRTRAGYRATREVMGVGPRD
jgi:Ca-activated chloride channel homolog